MKTHRHSSAKDGDVIAVQGPHGTMCHVVVTDPDAQGRVSEGGYNCREATVEEVRQASREGRVRYEG